MRQCSAGHGRAGGLPVEDLEIVFAVLVRPLQISKESKKTQQKKEERISVLAHKTLIHGIIGTRRDDQLSLIILAWGIVANMFALQGAVQADKPQTHIGLLLVLVRSRILVSRVVVWWFRVRAVSKYSIFPSEQASSASFDCYTRSTSKEPLLLFNKWGAAPAL